MVELYNELPLSSSVLAFSVRDAKAQPLLSHARVFPPLYLRSAPRAPYEVVFKTIASTIVHVMASPYRLQAVLRGL